MREVRNWWLKQAEMLHVGDSIKVRHINDPPTASESVLIYNLPNGYGAKCFRRGTRDWKSKVWVSLADLNKALELSGGQEVPDDLVELGMNTHQPGMAEALGHLFDRGVDPEYNLVQDMVKFSPSRMRLVYTGVDVDGKQTILGRDVTGKHKAKVITYTPESGGRGRHTLLASNPNVPHVVITEDINSALKVQSAIDRYGLHRKIGALSLNGTAGSNALTWYCIDKKVLIWLDNDTAGKAGSVKLYKELTPLANTVKLTVSKGDPKEESLEAIRDRLETVLGSIEDTPYRKLVD